MTRLDIRQYILDGTPEDIVWRYESLPQKAQSSSFGPLDSNVVVLDTETTGFSFTHDELIQIAAARLEQGKISEWYVTFVNPGHEIPEDIVHLTGIRDEDVIQAPSPQEALSGLVEFAGDALIVAHNVGFDKSFVTRHPEGYSLLNNTWIDSLDLSRIALPRLKSHRLIDLVHAFGAPISTHRADDDVAATCVVYRILLAAITSMPQSLVRAIGDMAPKEEWSTGYAFSCMAEFLEEATCDDVSLAGDTADDVAEPAPLPSASAVADLRSVPSFSTKYMFSLLTMRQKRINQLLVRPPRIDANDLVGELVFPERESIESAFSESGLLGRIYENYEPRKEQLAMAVAINDAFAADDNLMVEAGTGVGKSMAYLVNAALFALQNGVCVGVATKTNTLLDQLVYQELPALAQELEEFAPELASLSWAPLKGMAHYPCLRKISRIVDKGPELKEIAGNKVSQAPALAALLSYVEQSEFNDIDALKIDYRSLPRYSITSGSSECLRRKCPYFAKLCFAHGARRRAETADIMVTNHALLFCNVAAEGALLPPIRHWIVDEAHSCEQEARQALACELSSEQLERMLSHVGPEAGARSVFSRTERALARANSGQVTQFNAMVTKAKQAAKNWGKVVSEYLPAVKDLLFFDTSKAKGRGQSYDRVDIWINQELRSSQVFGGLKALAYEFIDENDKLIACLQNMVAFLEGIDEASVVQRELASITLELRDFRNAAEVIFGMPSDRYVYQASIMRKKDRYIDTLQAQLIDVGEVLNERFYAQAQSVIYASATLTIGRKFESFQAALGLNAGEFSNARTLMLNSSYDFDNNMLIYVVSDMPEPNEATYQEALNELLIKVHRANRGSMLTLFTNRREMERSHSAVAPALKEHDLRLVCQKWGVSVKGLRDDFIADKNLSLFALKSFWEGFDAPGQTLRGVVIPKLPFGRPSDPLYCERASRDDKAWWHYVLPQAIIETKQAAGRLIRKADDRGVLILADKRLLTKRYGKLFLSSLQSSTVREATMEEIATALAGMNLRDEEDLPEEENLSDVENLPGKEVL